MFSAGLVAAVAVRIGFGRGEALLAALLAAAMQLAIDAASHEVVYAGGRRVVRRTPLLHSPTGALLAALAFTAPAAALLGRPLRCALLMLLASASHLALDAPTERGIYLAGRRLWRRRALSNRSPALNALFAAAGLYLLYTALLP